jgi:hypothetical protein
MLTLVPLGARALPPSALDEPPYEVLLDTLQIPRAFRHHQVEHGPTEDIDVGVEQVGGEG